MEATEYLDSWSKEDGFGGKGCHGVGSRLCPAIVLVLETKLCTNESTSKKRRMVKDRPATTTKKRGMKKDEERERFAGLEMFDKRPILLVGAGGNGGDRG